MRLLLSSLILLFVQLFAFSQEKYDAVNIYLYPHTPTTGTASSECYWNENSLRVNADIKIFISETNEVNRIQNILLNDELRVETDSHFFQCQIVVDFIKSGKIRETIAFSRFRQIRRNGDDSIIYKSESELDDFFSRYLRFWF